MPLYPTWEDIALRLALTLAAGALIGFNREAHGHAAGLRTTMLVCLAASVAMILANVILPTGGKTDASFARIDVMRLPLGILTGVGFIGGGAIFRRDDLVTGVTTAATLWVVTVIGLCFGGGAIALGLAATVLSVVIVWALKWIDSHTPRDQVAILSITAAGGSSPSAAAIRDLVQSHRCNVQLRAETQSRETGTTVTRFHVHWRGPRGSEPPLRLAALLEQWPGVSSAAWETERLD
jgi:putative Mg2+ transporter-C (MgtC) family protein